MASKKQLKKEIEWLRRSRAEMIQKNASTTRLRTRMSRAEARTAEVSRELAAIRLYMRQDVRADYIHGMEMQGFRDDTLARLTADFDALAKDPDDE